MKKANAPVRASHVNKGTSVARADLRQPSVRGDVMRHPKLTIESESGESTAYGGLALAASLVSRLGVAKELNESLDLLQSHRPFTEADHVLAHAYNLFVGGTCLEDLANLQGSEAVLRLLGAARLPDPTTAGDFLRRFGEDDLGSFDEGLDRIQAKVWKKRYGRKKAKRGIVDLDSHVRTVYGRQKEGADFSYKGTWAYHPLVISLAETHECLRLVNRPGNAPSAQGSVEQLEALFPLLKSRFREIIVRGDSAFCDHGIFDLCEEQGVGFAVVCPSYANVVALAEKIPEAAWKPFVAKGRRREPNKSRQKRRRARRKNLRRARALRHKKRDLRLRRQWTASVEYRISRSPYTYRLIIRRQRIDETDKQGQLFELWRYRFVLTNLTNASDQEVVDLTYERCDQENLIEQLQNGVAGMRMPTGTLYANAAFLTCARLAHNLKSWLAQIALPRETMRWEWKRFRLAYVYIATRVIHSARRVIVRLAKAHRFTPDILRAHAKIQV